MATSAPNRGSPSISTAPASRRVGGCDTSPGKVSTSWCSCRSVGGLTAGSRS